MKSKLSALLLATGLMLGATNASAASFVVKAMDNSSGGGTALNTGIALTSGQTLVVSSSTNDLWSAGAADRISDANGLTGLRLATALDDSGKPVGTVIGGNYGIWSSGGLAAPYGSLGGRIGSSLQLLGANYTCPAWATGNLELFYWDSNSGDNFGEITFEINAKTGGSVPEPTSWAMMLTGFALLGTALRRSRRTARVRYT